MSKDNVVALSSPESVEDPLTELLRSGAKRLIQQAIEAELADLLAQYAGQLDEQGRRAVVRNGYLPEQVSLRSRERFWDIRVPKIDSIFDNSLVPRPSWSPGVPPQHRKLVAATHRPPI